MLLQRRKLAKSLIKDEADYVSKFNEFENLYREYPFDDCQKVGSLVIGLCDNKEFIYDRKCFDETIYVDFEGYKLPIPAGFKDVLTISIGANYMEPKIYPSDHGSVYFDPHVCYKQYLPKLRKDYSLFSRIKRAIFAKFGGSPLSELERQLYKL